MRPRWILLAAVALVALLALARLLAPALVAAGVRAAASSRGLVARWERLRFRLPPRAEFRLREPERLA